MILPTKVFFLVTVNFATFHLKMCLIQSMEGLFTFYRVAGTSGICGGGDAKVASKQGCPKKGVCK